MRLVVFFILIIYSIPSMVNAQQRIYLYADSDSNIIKNGFDTVKPYMEYYLATNQLSNNPRTAILICPGGGYKYLAWEKEGVKPAKFFNSNGIDVFVLHYRVNDEMLHGHGYPAQYNDANKALNYIYDHADSFHIQKNRIGIMGFSAGGHLAATISTLNPLNPKTFTPSFSILVYPVITMENPYAHAGSKKMLLGEDSSADLIKQLSVEKNISPNTPPAIIIQAGDDKTVPVQNSIMYYEQLLANHIPAALFIYDHGKHGFGMAENDPWLSQWPQQVVAWLKECHFL
ncbi:alpha/beta hydrolase [Hydrotalea sp.]|uniref:alpha/beta hydrolase n=1 Tax=Hydrotalea sp. TaxID=2881279 RepID=UPI003D0AA43B